MITEGNQGDTQDIVKKQSMSLVKGDKLTDKHQERSYNCDGIVHIKFKVLSGCARIKYERQ